MHMHIHVHMHMDIQVIYHRITDGIQLDSIKIFKTFTSTIHSVSKTLAEYVSLQDQYNVHIFKHKIQDFHISFILSSLLSQASYLICSLLSLGNFENSLASCITTSLLTFKSQSSIFAKYFFRSSHNSFCCA